MKQITVAVALLLFPVAPGMAEESVFVVNLPEVQRVDGEVSIREPAPGTTMVRLPERIVAPVARTETASLVSGGVVDVAGFRGAVVSVVGVVQGRLGSDGIVGAVLVPDEEPIVQAFDEAGLIQLGLDASAGLARSDAYFAGSEPLQLAFPRYRVFYYNTTDRAVSARLFIYLMN